MVIAVASGKGGAGKTSIASSLASIWKNPLIAVDADVEAPNLSLYLKPDLSITEKAFLKIPILSPEKCTRCGRCREICRYKAIAKFAKKIKIFEDMCHGCGGCFEVCPEDALSIGSRELGEVSYGTFGNEKKTFAMGRSRIGEAMTPPLLRILLKKTESLNAEDALIDCPPGVSCPAMTVIRRSDMVLLVAESTPFGFHDFQLALKAVQKSDKPVAIILNKSKMPGNVRGDKLFREYCKENQLALIGEIPFEREAAEQYAHGQLLTEISSTWRSLFEITESSLMEFWAAAQRNIL